MIFQKWLDRVDALLSGIPGGPPVPRGRGAVTAVDPFLEAKARVLDDLTRGMVGYCSAAGLPFHFVGGERLVWRWEAVACYEVKTRRVRVGRSSGVSLRLARGVYVRTGSYAGVPVDEDVTVLVGTGELAVTTQHLYFSCPQRSVRLPWRALVTLKAYTDGLEVCRDTAAARPMTFITGDDGTFVVQLVELLPRVC